MAKYFTTGKLSENIHETPEGFLVCYAVPIGRTGEMVYGKGEIPLEPGPDGRILVTREASELFHPDTLSSFEGKAFTLNHPSDFVDPSNWSDLAKGVLQNVRKGELDEEGFESLIADVLVTDKKAIQMIKIGVREVSCGYEAIYEQTGIGTGRQTQIRGNHLALVDEGRAGPSYAINDHKFKTERFSMKSFADKLKGILAKTIDETMGMETISGDEVAPKKEDKKEESKDAEPKVEEKKKEESKDAEEVAPSLEDRLKALEMAVSKLLERESAEESVSMDEDMESSTGDEESMKEKELEKKKTGDQKQKKTGLEQTKNVQSFDHTVEKAEMTAEQLNEKNQAFWSRK